MTEAARCILADIGELACLPKATRTLDAPSKPPPTSWERRESWAAACCAACQCPCRLCRNDRESGVKVYFRPGAIRRSAGEDGDPDKADPLNLASFDETAQSDTD